MAHRPVTGGRTYRRVRGCSGRSSSTWRVKQILASLIVIGALSSLTAGTTFALLNSQESNANASIASGTLTLSNIVNTGTACFSYGGPASPGNVNTACQALFTSATQNYPGNPVTAKVTILNNGSIDASDLSVYMPSCTNGVTPGAPAPGGGDPCGPGGAQFYIQETDASWNPVASCLFPSAATACTFVAHSLYVFSANASSITSAFDLGSGPAHGQARYFLIGMQLPSNASNTLQGQAAQFGVTWHITS
jgi:hypothetical protein